MSYNVSLFAEAKLSDNRKYVSKSAAIGLSAIPLWAGQVVIIGNFANVNLFCDNSVELECGQLGVIPAITIAHRSTHIMVSDFTGYNIIGAITGWDYINDSNVRISYKVDAFMSAIFSGKIQDIRGLCERTNFHCGDKLFANLQSEPFHGSDYSYADPVITSNFNEGIHQFEGITPGSSGIGTSGTCFILTVSTALADFVGASAFSTPSIPSPELKDTSSFLFSGSEVNANCGGTFRGVPLKFSSLDEVSAFCLGAMSGCGFKTTLPASGYSSMQSVTNRMYSVSGDNTAATFFSNHKNWNNDPYECVRFITGNDIYNLYCIPEKFAIADESYQTGVVTATDFPDLESAFAFGTEGQFAGKLLSHPYIYYKLVTANGDNVEIIPQVHYEKSSPHTPSFSVSMSLRFIGGDTPHLMGRIIPAGSDAMTNGQEPYQDDSVAEWFTIRNYPSVTLSYNSNINQQAMRDISSNKKIAQKYVNSVAMNRLSSPILQGYRDGINGTVKNDNPDRGLLGLMGAVAGTGVAALQKIAGIDRSLLSDTVRQELRNDYAMGQADNFITPEFGTVMGNDFASQYGVPAISAYWQGASDAELFSFARYMEQFGQTANGICNPITKENNILGGLATIYPVDGQVFYKFQNIQITGTMPYAWRQSIKDLFESGVYLME